LPGHARRTSALKKADILRIAEKATRGPDAPGRRSQALFAVPGSMARGGSEDPSPVVLGVYDYDRDRSLVMLVNAQSKEVITVRETKAQFQLSDEERAEAERIAGEDPRVRAHLAGRDMNPLTRLYFPPGQDSSSGHRHAIVFLRPTRSERWYAVVDLSAGITVDVVSRRELAGE
jgi:hypothetical protein